MTKYHKKLYRPPLRIQKKFVAALGPAWRKRIYELKDLKVFSLRDFSSDFSNYVTGNLWCSLLLLLSKNHKIWYDVMICLIRGYLLGNSLSDDSILRWNKNIFSNLFLLIMRGHVYCFEIGNYGYQFPDLFLTTWLEIMMDLQGREIWKHRHR